MLTADKMFLVSDIDGPVLTTGDLKCTYNTHPQFLSTSLIDHATKGAYIDPDPDKRESKRVPYSGLVVCTHRAKCTVHLTEAKLFSIFEEHIDRYKKAKEENSFKVIKEVDGVKTEVLKLCPKNVYLSYIIKNLMNALEEAFKPLLPFPLLAVSTPDDRGQHEEFTSKKTLEAKVLQCGEGFRTTLLPAEIKYLAENNHVTEEQLKKEVGHLATAPAEVAALRQEIKSESKSQEVKGEEVRYFDTSSKNNQLLQIAWFLAKLNPNETFIMVYVDDREDLLKTARDIKVGLFPNNLVAIHCYQHLPNYLINFKFFGMVTNPYREVKEQLVIPGGGPSPIPIPFSLPISTTFMKAFLESGNQKDETDGLTTFGLFHNPDQVAERDTRPPQLFSDLIPSARPSRGNGPV